MIPNLQQVTDHWATVQQAIDLARTVSRQRYRDENSQERLRAEVRHKLEQFPIPGDTELQSAWLAVRDFFGSIRSSIEVLDPRCCTPGAQDGEDRILDKLLPGPGSYLDLGASEPRECSNTWGLYRRGWRGLLVEPLPWRTHALCLQRPRDLVAPLAIMDYDGHVEIRVAGTCSSTVSTWAIQEWGRILAPCVTVATLLDRYPMAREARYCSIDIEGAEDKAFACWPWDAFRPEVISVEHVEYNPVAVGQDFSGQWAHHLTDHGYREYARTRFNIIYRREA